MKNIVLIFGFIFILVGCGGGVSDAIGDALSGMQSKDVNKDIKDNTTIPIFFNVSTNYKTITKVSMVTLDIQHQRMGDLKIELTDPSGTTVVLSNYRGGNSSVDTLFFKDDAKTSIVNFNSSETDYRPEESLSKFVGDKANGIWMFKITDSVKNSKTGKIRGVGIVIEGVK